MNAQPVVRHKGKLYHIETPNPMTNIAQAFKITANADDNLEPVACLATEHGFLCPGVFSPNVKTTVEQIPTDLLEEVDFFEVVEPGMLAMMNISKNLERGFHKAVTLLYKRC